MKKSVIVFFGMFAAAASLSASAQTPAWFVLKHPEVKTMERMQAQQQTAPAVAHSEQVAVHDTTAEQTPAWFVLKHPEVKIMERMQAQEAAHKQQFAMHDAEMHHRS